MPDGSPGGKRSPSPSRSPETNESKRRSLESGPNRNNNLFSQLASSSSDNQNRGRSVEITGSSEQTGEQRYLLLQTYPNRYEAKNTMEENLSGSDMNRTLVRNTERENYSDVLRQELEADKANLKKSDEFLEKFTETFGDIMGEIGDLEQWNEHEETQAWIRDWREANRDAPEPDQENIYYEINVAHRVKINLDVHLDAIDAVEKSINQAIDELSPQRFPIAEDYNDLKSRIEKIDDPTLLQEVLDLQARLTKLKWNQIKAGALVELGAPGAEEAQEEEVPEDDMASEEIEPMLERVNKLREKRVGERRIAAAEYDASELNRPPGHPFFLQTDMVTIDAEMEIVPRGLLYGGGLIHMSRTILRAQKADVSEEDKIVDTLGVHPHGGGVSIKQLEARFAKLTQDLSALENQKEYRYRKIEAKDLEKALSDGPIGAFLSTDQLNDIPRERRFQHAVTLKSREWNETTREHELIVIDELGTRPQQPQLAVSDGLITTRNRSSQIRPYRISVNTFMEKGWTRGVFLSKDASDAIDQGSN